MLILGLATMVPISAMSGNVVLAAASSATLNVSRPVLAPGQESTITQHETAVVWVNVRSEYDVENVTLNYIQIRGDIAAPLDLDRYKTLSMDLRPGSEVTYQCSMPAAQNETWVWGIATAFDKRGNFNESENGEPQRIYFAMTPNPNSSRLDLDIAIRDVDPKSVIMNITINVHLTNYESYSGEHLFSQDNYIDVPVTQRTGTRFDYGSGYYPVTLFYRITRDFGHPEVYPFDRYYYAFNLTLPKYVNQTTSLNGKALTSVSVEQVRSEAWTPAGALDISDWRINSGVRFFPSRNFTACAPYLSVTVILERQPEQILYLFFLPVFSLFALLGVSVLLRGQNEIRNRLLVYLNVLVFSYGFNSSVKSLPIAPTLLEVSMIERLILGGLIPCTVILAVVSILGTVIAYGSDHKADTEGTDKVVVLDLVGVLIAVGTVYYATRMQLFVYPWDQPITYTLLDTGWYGWAIIFAILMGIVLDGVLRGRNRLKGTKIFFWTLLVVLFAILAAAWVTRGNEFAIFLATAIGVIASTAFTFYQQYLRTPELHFAFDPEKHARQLTILDTNTGNPIDEFRFVYLQVENTGNLVAEKCVGQIRLLEQPNGCTMFSDESKGLKWVEIAEGDSISPHGGTALLGVAFSRKTSLPALSGPRCALQPGNTIVRAWANTKGMISLVNPNLRLQDAFCTGDFKVRIAVSSSNSDPISKDFILQVADNWENLRIRNVS
jgi:hypothetical protein